MKVHNALRRKSAAVGERTPYLALPGAALPLFRRGLLAPDSSPGGVTPQGSQRRSWAWQCPL